MKKKLTGAEIRRLLTKGALHRIIIVLFVPLMVIGLHAEDLPGLIMALIAIVMLGVVAADSILTVLEINKTEEYEPKYGKKAEPVKEEPVKVEEVKVEKLFTIPIESEIPEYMYYHGEKKPVQRGRVNPKGR